MVRISLPKKTKSDNYPKSSKVNRADIRWKEYVLNRRGLAGGAKKKSSCSNNELRGVSRGHSTY